MFAPAVVWAKCWGHSLSEACRKEGEEVAMQAKFVPGGFFLFVCFRLHLGKHRGCTRNAVGMRDDDWEILGVQEARLSWTANDCVLFFFSSTLSDERCSNLSFESPNQNPKNRTLNSHRDTGGTRCVLWEATRYGHLPLTKLGFLAVPLWPIFLLKCPLRLAILQLEFKWSKPDEKHPKQSKTETRKTAFRSSKHWNHMQVTDRPRTDAPSPTQTIIVQMVYLAHLFSMLLRRGATKYCLRFFNFCLGT